MSGKDKERKQDILTNFNKVASTYGSDGPGFFNRCGRRLVELSKIAQGMRCLDVATGRGAVLIPALERVGDSGRVVGIDLSDGMINETSAQIKKSGIKNVDSIKWMPEN